MANIFNKPKTLFVEENQLVAEGYTLAGTTYNLNRPYQFVSLDDIINSVQMLSNVEAEELIKLQNDENISPDSPAVYSHGEVWRAYQFLISELKRLRVNQ